MPFRSMIAPNYPLKGLFSGDFTQPPLWAAWDPTRGCGSPTDALSAIVNMSEATYLACYWLFGMTPAILHWYQRGRAPTQVPDPVAPLRPCCGKTWQSKRLSSILIVQSRISGNFSSSLFISTLVIHPLWAFLPLHPSFGLSPTSPICRVLVGISFGIFMALFPLLSSNLYSELILRTYCAVLGNPLTFFLLLDARKGGVGLSLVHFSRAIVVS